MARLPALISAIADGDDRDRAAVDNISRVVREAGFIATTKRGRGASEMTVADAASLLIGAYGCLSPIQAADAVRHFRSLRPTPRSFPVPSDFGALTDLRFDQNFGEIVESLLARASDVFDRLFSAQHAYNPALSDFNLADLKVSFQVLPIPAAEISLWLPVGVGSPELAWQASYVVDADLLLSGFYSLTETCRRVVTTINFGVFLRLHEAMFGASDPVLEAEAAT